MMSCDNVDAVAAHSIARQASTACPSTFLPTHIS